MRGLDSPPGVWDRQRQRKEKQVKSISHSDFAIPSRGLTTERFSKAGPAPNAESCLNCPMSLVEPLVLSKKGAFWRRFCAQAVSLWTVNGPFLFVKTKRNGGFIPAPQSGALPPVPAPWAGVPPQSSWAVLVPPDGTPSRAHWARRPWRTLSPWTPIYFTFEKENTPWQSI